MWGWCIFHPRTYTGLIHLLANRIAVVMATRLITLTGGGPWGFTLSGGRDFGSHFMISKVTRILTNQIAASYRAVLH